MSKSGVLILVGILLIILPFAGLPSSWLEVIVPILGVVACIIGFLIREAHVKKSMEMQPQAEPVAQIPHEAEKESPPVQTPHGVSPI